SASSSLLPMASKARPNVPPRNSPKPVGLAAHLRALLARRRDLWGCPRSGPCRKRLFSPACARPGCRRNDERSATNPAFGWPVVTVNDREMGGAAVQSLSGVCFGHAIPRDTLELLGQALRECSVAVRTANQIRDY